MSAKPLTECPQCGGSLKRIIGTGAGPIFKGSGFYQTDYKSNSPQNKKSKEADNKTSSTDKNASKGNKK
jgi:predicted nucleic acid-binding Zn ribbon protein